MPVRQGQGRWCRPSGLALTRPSGRVHAVVRLGSGRPSCTTVPRWIERLKLFKTVVASTPFGPLFGRFFRRHATRARLSELTEASVAASVRVSVLVLSCLPIHSHSYRSPSMLSASAHFCSWVQLSVWQLAAAVAVALALVSWASYTAEGVDADQLLYARPMNRQGIMRSMQDAAFLFYKIAESIPDCICAWQLPRISLALPNAEVPCGNSLTVTSASTRRLLQTRLASGTRLQDVHFLQEVCSPFSAKQSAAARRCHGQHPDAHGNSPEHSSTDHIRIADALCCYQTQAGVQELRLARHGTCRSNPRHHSGQLNVARSASTTC